MNRTLRTILAVIFIAVITGGAISITDNLFKPLRVDMTDKQLYTLSDGTRSILQSISDPITLTLYYSRTAAMKAPDQIQFLNQYYHYVRDLLEEYRRVSDGAVNIKIVDPRPFSDAEVDAMSQGLKHFPINEEENFFFGLVGTTPFGVTKSIPFFAPDRQNLIEYDVSELIDSMLTRAKTRLGILSSIDLFGDAANAELARLMQMQGQQPKGAWAFIDQLRSKFDVKQIDADTDSIDDVDILMVVHPKKLPDKTLFAIDQFVLSGGRAMFFVDPHCLSDPSLENMQMGSEPDTASDINTLLNAWGMNVPALTFAGDEKLMMSTPMRRGARPEPVIGFLQLNAKSFNADVPMTAELDNIAMLFSGVVTLRTMPGADAGTDSDAPPTTRGVASLTYSPLLSTTATGNTFSVPHVYSLLQLNPDMLLKSFTPGTEPVVMAMMANGTFPSAFPDGLVIEDPCAAVPEAPENGGVSVTVLPEPTIKTGLTESSAPGAVVVVADVDFISDMIAYQRNPFFGTIATNDSGALLLNAVEQLGGSDTLIAVRSRGNYKRPFTKIDEVELAAGADTAKKEQAINAEIQKFQAELSQIISQSDGKDQAVLESSILAKKRDLELKIRQAQRELRQVSMEKRKTIESYGTALRSINVLVAPAVILLIAIILAGRRAILRRRFVVAGRNTKSS